MLNKRSNIDLLEVNVQLRDMETYTSAVENVKII